MPLYGISPNKEKGTGPQAPSSAQAHRESLICIWEETEGFIRVNFYRLARGIPAILDQSLVGR